MAISGAYFDVLLVGPGAVLAGDFLAVSGLDMEADYEVYTEGGSSYPLLLFQKCEAPAPGAGEGRGDHH